MEAPRGEMPTPLFGCLGADGQKIRLETARNDDLLSQSCSQTAALARFRALVKRRPPKGGPPPRRFSFFAIGPTMGGRALWAAPGTLPKLNEKNSPICR